MIFDALRAVKIFKLDKFARKITKKSTLVDALEFYVEFKSELKKQCKFILARYHPDHGGNHDDFVEINNLRAYVESDLFPAELWASKQKRDTLLKVDDCGTLHIDGVFLDRYPNFLRSANHGKFIRGSKF